MKIIHKYNLEPGRMVLNLPEDTQFLSVQAQYNNPVLWVLKDTDKPDKEYLLELVCTGQPLQITIDRTYLGTIQMDLGSSVFHLFLLP